MASYQHGPQAEVNKKYRQIQIIIRRSAIIKVVRIRNQFVLCEWWNNGGS